MKIVPLGHVQPGSGSIFMDNLTVSCALRPVSGYRLRTDREDQVDRIYPEEGIEFYRAAKWDYPLNDAFRFAVDLSSLGQLVEAVVIFDKTYVDSLWADRWGGSNRNHEHMALPTCNRLLAPILVPVAVPSDTRMAFLASAMQKAWAYSRHDAFGEFMRLLSVTGTESAFVHMSHGYFETGYSDNRLFPHDEVLSSDIIVALHKSLIDSLVHALEPLTDVPNAADLKKVRGHFDEALAAAGSIVKRWYDIMDSDVLGKTDFDLGDSHDKRGASEDVLRNATAAFFYHAMADHCGLPYFPHLLRSSFVAFDQVVSEEGIISTAKKAVESVEKARRRRTQPMDAFYGRQVAEIEIPALLSAALQHADAPAQILQVAVQMRNTSEAQEFRKWATDVDRRLAEGTMDLKRLRSEIEDIRGFLKEWSGNMSRDTKGRTVRLVIGVGPLTVDLPWAGLPLQMRRKRHLTFLQRLSHVSDTTVSFTKLVEKVFGRRIAAFYGRYRTAISEFRHPAVDPIGKSRSPLDRRHRAR